MEALATELASSSTSPLPLARVDLSRPCVVPPGLKQEYVFMPSRVKITYFVQLLRALEVFAPNDADGAAARSSKERAARRADEDAQRGSKRKQAPEHLVRDGERADRATSAIVFVQTCKRCHELHALLTELGVEALALHSKLGQRRRLASLGKFKSQICRVLVCTDVASRGLDIPHVDLVVNFDLPRDPDDYVHRAGRTARAGAQGLAVSFVTQHDLELLGAIEKKVGTKLEKCQAVNEKAALALLNPVAKAMIASQNDRPWDDGDS